MIADRIVLPTHCPYCGSSISKTHMVHNHRVYTCGAMVSKETEKFTKICDKSKQQGLF